jgi:6-bladed beta-propeller
LWLSSSLLLSLSFSLLTLVIFVIAITFLATISTVSIVYAPVVEEEADNVGPPTQSSASPSSPSPSPSLPVTPNASAANTSSFFIREWGGSCLVSSNTNCVDPDGPTGNLSVGNGQFWGIWGVAANSSNVFVADVLNNRVQKFDLNGTFIRSWGSFCDLSTGQGCLDPDGPAGNLSLGDGQFNYPQGVAIDSNASNNIYVADSKNNRIQKFDDNGTFIKKWGSVGNGVGEFRRPADVAVDSSIVYVVDAENDRIQEFNSNGTFIKSWGSECLRRFDRPMSSGCTDMDGPLGNLTTGQGQFNRPAGIAIASGVVIIADNSNDLIQTFKTSTAPAAFSTVDKLERHARQ